MYGYAFAEVYSPPAPPYGQQLHLGKCHVLALLQLDEIFLAIDDLKTAVLVNLANVARVEPAHAVLIDREVLLILLDDVRVGLLGEATL